MSAKDYEPARVPLLSPAWTKWAVPSVVDQIFVGLLFILVCTPRATSLLSDPDIGWHIRAGQQILDTHLISRADSFTSTMGGKLWFNWEWLYDVIVGALDRVGGLNAVVWFTSVIVIGVFCWVFRGLVAQGTHIICALVLTLLAAKASMIHLLARPHVLSWLFALIYFWALDSTDPDKPASAAQRRLWLLPPVMMLWANLHGEFPLGLILIGVYWIASILPPIHPAHAMRTNRAVNISMRPRTIQLTGVGAACALASLVNPYGWRLHAHVYSYLANRFFTTHVEEMQSPDFHGIAQQCFLALVLIAVAMLVLRASRVRISQLLVVLFAIYAGLYATRGLPTSAMLMVMITGPLLPSARSGFLGEIAAAELRQRGHVWPLVAIAASGWIAVKGGHVGSTQLMDAHFDPTRVPAGAVDYIDHGRVPSPILSLDTWGGYLTYRLFPRALTMVDDRFTLFGEDFMKAYLGMLDVQPGWEEFLRKHPAALIVLPRDAALTVALSGTAEWKSIYRDDVSVVFAPTQPGSTPRN